MTAALGKNVFQGSQGGETRQFELMLHTRLALVYRTHDVTVNSQQLLTAVSIEGL